MCMGTLCTSLQHPFPLLCELYAQFLHTIDYGDAWTHFAHPCNTLFSFFATLCKVLHTLFTFFAHSMCILCTPLGLSLHNFYTFLTHSFIFITMQWETVVNKRIRSDRFSASLLVISTGLTDFICAYNNQWGVRKLRPYGLTNWSNV